MAGWGVLWGSGTLRMDKREKDQGEPRPGGKEHDQWAQQRDGCQWWEHEASARTHTHTERVLVY